MSVNVAGELLWSVVRDLLVFRKIRGVVSRWPGYQQFPGHSKVHTFKMRVRVLLSLTSESLRMSSLHRRRIRELRLYEGRFEGLDVLVLGNGPSTGRMDVEKILNFKGRGNKISVMNDFAASELSKLISASFYFLVDPSYWQKDNEYSKTKEAISDYCAKNANTCMVIPANRELWFSHANIMYIDYRTCAGLIRFCEPYRAWGLPASVTLISLATCKFLGFKSILYSGMDSTSYMNFFVDDLNCVKFTFTNNYFDVNLSRNSGLSNEIRDMRDWPLRNLSDVFYAQAVFLDDFRYLATKTNSINVGSDKSNDASWRACLI